MAYLMAILKLRCSQCLRPAVVEVFNRLNSLHGRYCRSCGARALKELERAESGKEAAGG